MKTCMKQLLCLLLLSFSVISVTLGLNVADDAEPGQFPSVVYIKGKNTECAGAIIDQSWILTTAQCVYGQSPQNVMVLAGTNRKENTSGTAFSVSKIVVHEDFTKNSFLINDIALVKIDGLFEFDNLIKPVIIKAPPQSYNLVTATGWSLRTLYYTSVLMVDYDTCTRLLNETKGCAYPRGPGQFCTAMNLDNTPVEDVNGPLFHSVGYLAGLISYTVTNLYHIQLVFVNTVADYYNDWINNVITNN